MFLAFCTNLLPFLYDNPSQDPSKGAVAIAKWFPFWGGFCPMPGDCLQMGHKKDVRLLSFHPSSALRSKRQVNSGLVDPEFPLTVYKNRRIYV